MEKLQKWGVFPRCHTHMHPFPSPRPSLSLLLESFTAVEKGSGSTAAAGHYTAKKSNVDAGGTGWACRESLNVLSSPRLSQASLSTLLFVPMLPGHTVCAPTRCCRCTGTFRVTIHFLIPPFLHRGGPIFSWSMPASNHSTLQARSAVLAGALGDAV